MKNLLPIAFLMILPVVAQAPDGLKVWTASELKAAGAKLNAKVDKLGVASETLANLSGNNVLLVHRVANGEAEFHDGAGDFTVIESGAGTLVLGGTVKDGKTTAPGEIRGPAIEGGQSHPVVAGDIINIPPKTPHQMMVPKGGQITYVVFKQAAK
ncbi:MAG: hypothetical protein LAQ30_17985 [Acidobacteriia bacterium]|nr:hypothetical protein [Terriglobia bacterium]